MYVLTDLKIWQKALDLSLEVYQATQIFPKHELYGLTSQIRTCSVSIPSNIAEGAGRETQADFCRFLRIARGSAYELQTQLYLANKLNYLNPKDFQQLLSNLEEVLRMLTGLQNSLQANQNESK